MRLAQVLYRFVASKPKLPFRFRGKHRIVKKPSMKDLLQMREDFEREERNMLILRHPYLTLEQEQCHMSHIDREATFIQKVYDNRIEKFEKHHTIADQLKHLRVTEGWD